MHHRSRSLVAAGVLLTAACAGAPRSSSFRQEPASRTDLITRTEMSPVRWSNAYDLVTSIRPTWLGRPGRTGRPREVQVVVDNIPLGGAGALRHISASDIESVRFYDPISAALQWGPRFGDGAIVITTRRGGG